MSTPNETPWLTVIVAAYNVADWIDETLASMLEQIDAGVRILIVNDGSRDSTLARIEACRARYPATAGQVEVITQENAGVSAARNRGVAMVTTPWLTFLDGDDYWLSDYYTTVRAMTEAGRAEVDLIEFNALSRGVDKKGEVFEKRLDCSALGRYRGPLGEAQWRQIFLMSRWYLWNRVFRTALFEGLEFPVGKRYEDLAVTPLVVLRAESVSATDRALIVYRSNPESISTNLNHTDMHHIGEHIQAHLAQVDRHDAPQHKRLLVLLACQTMLYYKMITNVCDGYVRSIAPLRRMIRRIRPYRRRHRIELPTRTRLLFMSPALSNLYTWLKMR